MTTASSLAPGKQILCIGNAIVDVLARVDDAFLEAAGCVKSAMNLVDMDRSKALYAMIPPATELSGGSASNTAVGVASYGGSVRYIGKVRDDQLGAVFQHDIRAAGVAFDSSMATSGEATATSIILVTPDAHRTMNTYLGACGGLSPDDIIESEVADCGIVYVEGYLWDRPLAKEAVVKAMDLAHKHGRQVSITLSDGFCVDRFRSEFLSLIEDKVDIVFANEDELLSLYQTDDFDAAASKLAASVKIAAITRGAAGAVVLSGSERFDIAVFETTVDDTTGAGDLFAAGFLYGLAEGKSLQVCGQLGCLAASEVISHLGARPNVNLAALAREKGLLA